MRRYDADWDQGHGRTGVVAAREAAPTWGAGIAGARRAAAHIAGCAPKFSAAPKTSIHVWVTRPRIRFVHRTQESWQTAAAARLRSAVLLALQPDFAAPARCLSCAQALRRWCLIEQPRPWLLFARAPDPDLPATKGERWPS